MSVQRQAPGEFSQWLRSNALGVLTIFGILIYAVFSIPTTFFYVRLGTTPSEVGFTYASVLSGAALGTTVILGLLIALFLYVVILFVYLIVLELFTIYMLVRFSTQPWLMKRDQKLDIDRFDAKLTIFEDIHFKTEPSWTVVERKLRRKRELSRLEDLTPAEASEMKMLNSERIYLRQLLSVFPSPKQLLRPRRWWVYGFFIYMIAATAVLTGIAVQQANDIRSGHAYDKRPSAFFEYHAEPVSISPASAPPPKSIQKLIGKRIFLLGQNAQYVVLFLPQNESTVRIPVDTVVVTSPP